jgi:hypothetical protein
MTLLPCATFGATRTRLLALFANRFALESVEAAVPELELRTDCRRAEPRR